MDVSMGRVFSYDSPVWKFMGRLIDFMFLTILWVVTSLPIITMGTATTTVYYITLKMSANKEEYLFSMYFKNFKRFFKETTKAWLLILLVGAILAGDFYICTLVHNAITTMLFAAFSIIMVIFVMTVTYLFPVMARLDNSIMGYVKAAFYLAIRYFSWSILIVVIEICLIALGIFAFWPLLVIVIGLSSYLQSLIFHQIFKQQGWEIE